MGNGALYMEEELSKKEKSLIRHGLLCGAILGFLIGFFICLPYILGG